MKRIIPWMLLAGLVMACQEKGPTVPLFDPQFAKPDCKLDPGHPSCKGGDGAYTLTWLGEEKVASQARDLSEGYPIYVSGVTTQENGSSVAAVWKVEEDGTVSFTKLDLGSYSATEGWGINHVGTFVVGRAESMNAVMWERPGEVWSGPTPLESVDEFTDARGVQDEGLIVGTTGLAYLSSKATLWTTQNPAVNTPLPPLPNEGITAGLGINNFGHVAGYGAAVDPNVGPFHALVWWPGLDGSYTAPCDLHAPEWGDVSSAAYTMSEPMGGKFFVIGVHDGVVIWEVDQDNCDWSVLRHIPDARAGDVEVVSGVGQAVGQSAGAQRPVRWLVATGEETVLRDTRGYATDINSAGVIVGFVQFKGTERAVMWTPKPNQ